MVSALTKKKVDVERLNKMILWKVQSDCWHCCSKQARKQHLFSVGWICWKGSDSALYARTCMHAGQEKIEMQEMSSYIQWMHTTNKEPEERKK